MSLARAIVTTAQSYIGTPYHHQGRQRGVGVDCVGLLVGVAKDLGLQHTDSTTYEQDPEPGLILEYLEAWCDRVEPEDARPGDVVAFWVTEGAGPVHAGVLTPTGLVHCWNRASPRKSPPTVVEHRFVGYWKEHAHSFWRYRWQQSHS